MKHIVYESKNRHDNAPGTDTSSAIAAIYGAPDGFISVDDIYGEPETRFDAESEDKPINDLAADTTGCGVRESYTEGVTVAHAFRKAGIRPAAPLPSSSRNSGARSLVAHQSRAGLCARIVLTFMVLGLVATAPAFGQNDPWSNAATRMGNVFSGPIAKGFSLVAIVIGGLEVGFGEGSSKRTVGGIIMGLGIALGAANFISWLFS